jgi:alpha-ketoglutaric semialdehyde dehydrogenase
MSAAKVLIGGVWRAAQGNATFRAQNPATGETLADEYPVSEWSDCDEMLTASARAAVALRSTSPEKISQCLTRFAERLEARRTELVEMAHLETALPKSPRLGDVELPRTMTQLRQAAAAALEGSWALPTIDSKANIRSTLAAIGPVAIFGPNNFPFAFNAVSGGDFAAALAAGNPVIAKGHPSHPGTTRLLAEEGLGAITDSGLPPATLQMIYHIGPESGLRLVSDHRIGASAFTGSRRGGLALKAAADKAGKPIYLEMSSLNPVVILPGAINERPAKVADEVADNCLIGTGQFCTKPGLIFLVAGKETDELVTAVKQRFESRPAGVLFGAPILAGLNENIAAVRRGGAELVAGGTAVTSPGFRCSNTLLRVDADRFLAAPAALQIEMFGNATLLVVCRTVDQLVSALDQLEGNLTGCVYSHTAGDDDTAYNAVAAALRPRVGRLLNDKMPPGVALSAAMNHGGPFPSTGHPGFTAVGIPASLRRFGMLQSYDNVRPARLPPILADNNLGKAWRLIDGSWTQGDVAAKG